MGFELVTIFETCSHAQSVWWSRWLDASAGDSDSDCHWLLGKPLSNW